MDKVEPKYRRSLNDEQLRLLTLLFSFRFATSDLIAERFNKPSGKFVQKRLNILIDQGYVGKRYDKSYKLQGKPASYYTLPKTLKLLQKKYPKFITDQTVKNRYRDKELTEDFINHCIDLLRVFLTLSKLYPRKLDWFSNVELRAPMFESFPKWLPDSYFRLELGTKENPDKHGYLLTLFDETTPFFVMVRRVKSYISYAETEDWEEPGELPPILLVCPNLPTLKRLRRQVVKRLDEASYDEVAMFYLSTKQELFSLSSGTDKIWQLATDVEEVKTLEKI